MTINSYEWNSIEGRFLEVENPTADAEDYSETILKAGYMREFSSEEPGSGGATINVYLNDDDPTKPRFYIDIMGENHGIATLVARDFPSLAATLQQIQPFLALIRLDQVVSGRASDRGEDR